MALGLCLPVFADDGGTNDPIIAEIARNNSLYVTVSSETDRTFTPADFPEVVANRVVCVKKLPLRTAAIITHWCLFWAKQII